MGEVNVRRAIARKLSFNEVKGRVDTKQQSVIKMANYMMKTPVSVPKLNMTGRDLIPVDIIDELISRFLANIPEEERADPLRACFQIELAHWFFVDNYCGEESSDEMKEKGLIPFLPFAKLMFERSPSLKQVPNIEKVVQEFKSYKSKVPTFGCILLNQELTKVVLVQGFGGTWGFPKGKINQGEDPAECAAREVIEETGYDSTQLLRRDHFIEHAHNDRWTRLYFVRGVDPKSVQLKPHTRFEIKNIGWFPISDLPENKNDTNVVVRQGFPCSAFHGVFPYVKRLRLWIDDKLSGRNTISAFKWLAVGRPCHILDKEFSPPHTPNTPKTPTTTKTLNFAQLSGSSSSGSNPMNRFQSNPTTLFPLSIPVTATATTTQKQSFKEKKPR